jgi:hypothetical protein
MWMGNHQARGQQDGEKIGMTHLEWALQNEVAKPDSEEQKKNGNKRARGGYKYQMVRRTSAWCAGCC